MTRREIERIAGGVKKAIKEDQTSATVVDDERLAVLIGRSVGFPDTEEAWAKWFKSCGWTKVHATLIAQGMFKAGKRREAGL